MTEKVKSDDLKERILYGLELTYIKLLEYKRMKKSDLVVIRDNKLVKLKVE